MQSPTYLPTKGGRHNSTITLVVGTGLGSIINNIMGAITKAAYESNGDSQQRQICCVVIAIKGLAKRVWQKWVGLILGQDFCLSFFIQIH